MKTTIFKPQTEFYAVIFAVVFILFWLFAAGSQLSDFDKFRGEMNNQVFSITVSDILVYIIPVIEITIAGLLAFKSTRFIGTVFTSLLMVLFTTYISLALLNVFNRMPCNCAGFLGHNSSWTANLIFNLFVVAIAMIGLILTYKDRERRKKGMDTIVSHAPLTA